MMRKGAQVLMAEFLKEPVKEAVREALREEAVAVKSTGGETQPHSSGEHGSSEGKHSQGPSQSKQDQESSGGGRSKLTMVGIVLAIAGITYLARKRMSSTSGSAWSEPSPGSVASDDAEDGYVSEGEMQTAETADESTNAGGTSPSTTSDQ